jgi:hypothetical protein
MKARTTREAVDLIHDGATLMIGGFLGVRSPVRVIEGQGHCGHQRQATRGDPWRTDHRAYALTMTSP